MQVISGIDDRVARQSKLRELPPPWNQLLADFAESNKDHLFKQQIDLDTGSKSFNFHKSLVTTQVGSTGPAAGQVILVEDRTNIDLLESELTHSERLASIGRLAAGVAHEIGNPLTGIASIAQNQGVQSASQKEDFEDILLQVKRINEIVTSLLAFARNEPMGLEDHENIELNACVRQAIQLVSLSEVAKQVQFEVQFDTSLWVSGSERQIVQIFVNLLDNACNVTDAGGTVEVKGQTLEDMHIVTVRDYGIGIKPEDQSRIFEPFYTTKPVGQGTGLGLSLVYSLVSEHGGKVSIDPNVTPGTVFEVRLPVSSAQELDRFAGIS